MTCRDYNDAIAESLDGTLDPAKQRALLLFSHSIRLLLGAYG